MVFCPHCGREVRATPHRPGYLAPTGPVSLPKQKSDTNVLVLIILIVVIVLVLPIFLAMILYVGVLEFGGDQQATPAASISRQTIVYGQKFTVFSMSSETLWSDVGIGVSDGHDVTFWSPSSSALAGGVTIVDSLGSATLGALALWCNVTDLEGNGVIDMGDSVTITTGSSPTFSAATTYTVWLLFEPTSVKIAQISFSG